MIEHGELSAQKNSRLGHDEIGLEVLPSERGGIQVLERHRHTRHRVDHVGQHLSVACFVVSGLEVTDLRAAEQDTQHFDIGGALSELQIEARAALFDEAAMKARCIGNRLICGTLPSRLRVQAEPLGPLFRLILSLMGVIAGAILIRQRYGRNDWAQPTVPKTTRSLARPKTLA
jgi:hypothetical protein